MRIFEFLFNQAPGSTNITDSSGLGNGGTINPVRAGATPAQVVSGFSPPGYAFNSLKYSVDDMPTSHGAGVEPDDQLQFLGVPVTPSILNINNTRAFSISFWAFHEAMPDPGGNPWDGPQTLGGKDVFCPQHTCGAEAFYIFVRTKNIGTSVPVAERGELAFTGDGPAIVTAGGIDTTTLGGTTSQGYHVPINTWVHIACVLVPPAGPLPGKWQIFVDGELKGEADALAGLADPATKIFSTEADGSPASGVDIRFGNFRGHFPPDGVLRPAPIASGANDYAFNGYLTAIRMYDHAQTVEEICADIAADTATPEVISFPPSIAFGEVAEGLVTTRPITVEVRGCTDTTLIASFVGAPGSFSMPLGGSVAISGAPRYDGVSEGTIWLAYTTGAVGSMANATVQIDVADAGFSEQIEISARTRARPTASTVLVLDRSLSMDGNVGVPGIKKVDSLRAAARTFVNLMQDGDKVGIVRYNQDAPAPYFPLTDVGLEDIGLGRNDAIAYINGPELEPSGYTSIGDGIFEGGNLLAGSADQVQAIVVMTDGIENRDRMLDDPDVVASLTDQTFAVGLGSPSTISTDALDAIVSGPLGYLVVTGEIDSNNRFKLIKYYTQILSDIDNMNIVVDPQGVVTSNKLQKIPYSLNETDIEVDVILLSPEARRLYFAMEAPDGTVIDSDSVGAFPNVRYILKDDIGFFRIRMPVFLDGPEKHVGGWKAHIGLAKKGGGRPDAGDGDDVAAGVSIPYAVMVRTRSNFEFVFHLTQPTLGIGEPFHLNVSLREIGIPVTSRFNVAAQITGPTGAVETVPLAPSGDGAYGLTLDRNVVPGAYTVRVKARGSTFKGSLVEREKTLTGIIQKEKLGTETPDRADIEDKLTWLNRCCMFIAALLVILILIQLFWR